MASGSSAHLSRKWPNKASGAAGDHLFGQARRLGHQVEVEADRGGDAVQDVPHVQRGQDVQGRQVGDGLGVVQAGADGDEGAAVVAGIANRSWPRARGDGHDVGGHCALGVDGPSVSPGSRCRRNRAGQGNHGVVGGEVGRDVAPHQAGLRKAV